MMKYELTLLFKTTEKEAKKIAETLFKDAKISRPKITDWREKELAYPIAKQGKAHFLFCEFESEPKNLPVLNNKLKLEERIIRCLVVKVK